MVFVVAAEDDPAKHDAAEVDQGGDLGPVTHQLPLYQMEPSAQVDSEIC